MNTFLFSLLLAGAVLALSIGACLLYCAVKRFRRRVQNRIDAIVHHETKKKKKNRHTKRAGVSPAAITTVRGPAACAWKRSSYAIHLASGLVMCALGGYLLQLFATLPRTDEQKAAAYMIKVLNRESSLRNHHVDGIDRGPGDVKPDVFARSSEELAGRALRDAGRIISAVTEGDMEIIQAIVVGYTEKPYALAQIASALNHLNHHLETKCVFYTHKKWFYIGCSKPKAGDCELVFSTEGEAPQVLMWIPGPRSGGALTPHVAKMPSDIVMKGFQTKTVETAGRKKAIEEASPYAPPRLQ